MISLQPKRFDTLPGSYGADKSWMHWKKTFEDYMTPLQLFHPNIDKFEVLKKFISTDVLASLTYCLDYESAIQVLESLFAKPKTQLQARHILATRKQKIGEGLAEYVAELKRLSRDCKFMSVTAEVNRKQFLRDVFINGIQSDYVREKLLDNEDIEFESAHSQACSFQCEEEITKENHLATTKQVTNSQIDRAEDLANVSTDVENFENPDCPSSSSSGFMKPIVYPEMSDADFISDGGLKALEYKWKMEKYSSSIDSKKIINSPELKRVENENEGLPLTEVLSSYGEDEVHKSEISLENINLNTSACTFTGIANIDVPDKRAVNSSDGKTTLLDLRIDNPSTHAESKQIILPSQLLTGKLTNTENTNVELPDKVKHKSDSSIEVLEVMLNVVRIQNKLWKQSYEESLSEMKSLNINTLEKLQVFVNLILDDAVSGPTSAAIYAKICKELSIHFKEVPLGNAELERSNDSKRNFASFRKILLNKCERNFATLCFEGDEPDEAFMKIMFSKQQREKCLQEHILEKEMWYRRMFGNVIFIGELFKLRMISETIIHNQCIVKLLRTDKLETLNFQLECVCALLTVVGKDLDHIKVKPRIDQYFCQIRKIITKRKISQHIKIAFQDVIDLRVNNWIPLNKEGSYNNQMATDARQKKFDSQLNQKQNQPKKITGKSKSYKDISS